MPKNNKKSPPPGPKMTKKKLKELHAKGMPKNPVVALPAPARLRANQSDQGLEIASEPQQRATQVIPSSERRSGGTSEASLHPVTKAARGLSPPKLDSAVLDSPSVKPITLSQGGPPHSILHKMQAPGTTSNANAHLTELAVVPTEAFLKGSETLPLSPLLSCPTSSKDTIVKFPCILMKMNSLKNKLITRVLKKEMIPSQTSNMWLL